VTAAGARGDTRVPLVLLAAFVAIWTLLAWRPSFREDWLLENVLVFAGLPVLVATYRRLRFSNLAYGALFAFLVAHEVGAHYTYSLVPYDDAIRTLTGRSLDALLGFERNHYDRLVHFLYGFLLLPVADELYAAVAPARGFWGFLLPVLFLSSHSVVYELVEWAAAETFGGDLGQAYLGTQGDVWDAQRDMALALGGALLAQSLRVALRARAGRASMAA
jgi:putative membrane protein